MKRQAKSKRTNDTPICPHCGWKAPIGHWHIAVHDGEEYSPVECGNKKCQKAFVAEAQVCWVSSPIERKEVTLFVDKLFEMVYCIRDNNLNDVDTEQYIKDFLREAKRG